MEKKQTKKPSWIKIILRRLALMAISLVVMLFFWQSYWHQNEEAEKVGNEL